MAEIYLCYFKGPEGFEKDVVIKRVRPMLADDPDFIQMFISEARLASRLNHANLVQIFDFDKHENTFYLAMEYVRGKSLWEVRKRCKELWLPMPPTLAAEIGVQVARGLQYAHRLTDRGELLQLVHRDVTPHNVLISYEGAVKLTDFGIAKAGSRLTSSGMLKGKFAYMAPEQARGEAVDCRTDIFALGIILWELVTGGKLFDGDSDVAVLKAVQESAIAEPARLNPEVAPELNAAIMRALNRDPTARFQTAQELELALAIYLLTAAKTLEDRDVGAFVRRAFAVEGMHPDALLERTESRSDSEAPAVALAPLPSVPERSTEPLHPDEDGNAATLVFPNGARAAGVEGASPSQQGGKRVRRRTLRLVVGGVLGVTAAGAGVLLLRASRTPRVAPANPEIVVATRVPKVLVADTDAGSGAVHARASDAGASAAVSKPRPPHLRSSAPTPGWGKVILKAHWWGVVAVDGETKEVEGSLTLPLSAGDHRLSNKAGQSQILHVAEGRNVIFDVTAWRLTR